MTEQDSTPTSRALESYKLALLTSSIAYIGMAIAFVVAVILAGDDLYELARPRLLYAYLLSFVLFVVMMRIGFGVDNYGQ